MNQSHSLFVLNSLSKKSKFQKIEFLTFLSNLKPKNHASDFGKKPDFLNSKICKNLNALDTRLHIYMPHRLPNEKCLTIKTRNICLFLWSFWLGCSQQNQPYRIYHVSTFCVYEWYTFIYYLYIYCWPTLNMWSQLTNTIKTRFNLLCVNLSPSLPSVKKLTEIYSVNWLPTFVCQSFIKKRSESVRSFVWLICFLLRSFSIAWDETSAAVVAATDERVQRRSEQLTLSLSLSLSLSLTLSLCVFAKRIKRHDSC